MNIKGKKKKNQVVTVNIDVYKRQYLMSTTEHPTADTVYLHVREEFPHISLGTVYRNLNLLADTGEAAVSYTHLDVYKRQFRDSS